MQCDNAAMQRGANTSWSSGTCVRLMRSRRSSFWRLGDGVTELENLMVERVFDRSLTSAAYTTTQETVLEYLKRGRAPDMILIHAVRRTPSC